MKKAIVGYTGFVGSNIVAKEKFDYTFNSKNIVDAYGLKPDILIYAGVRAEKFTANNNPSDDLAHINSAAENISKIAPKKLVLISTIDVYDNPCGAFENSLINESKLLPYGKHRLLLEKYAKEICNNTSVIRLPALFGENLKKNFIYDIINIIPTYLTIAKFDELAKKSNLIKSSYTLAPNGMLKVGLINKEQRLSLKNEFLSLNFSAANFTDSRASFAFYNLSNLASHIDIVIENDIGCLNTATEALSASEIYEYLFDKPFVNEMLPLESIPNYTFKTLYDKEFGGKNGYIFDKVRVLSEIGQFSKGVL